MKNDEKVRALKFIARSLDVDLEKYRVVTTTETDEARAETHDGRLKAIVYPDDAGSVKVKGLRLPGINIKVIDRSIPLHAEYPKGAVYILQTYFKREEYDEGIPGSMFIDEQGKFLAYEQCVKIV